MRNLMERIAIMHPGASLDGTDIDGLIAGPGKRHTTDGAHLHPAGLSNRTGDARADEVGDARNPQRSDITGPAAQEAAADSPLRSRIRNEERALLEAALEEAGWNVTLAAERLGIDRASLHRKMRRLRITRPGRR